jgi:hypothetical protein
VHGARGRTGCGAFLADSMIESVASERARHPLAYKPHTVESSTLTGVLESLESLLS